MSTSKSVTLCVQVWPFEGQEAALVDFEDRVLALIPGHGGALLQRVRRAGAGTTAYETHIIEFPDAAAHQAYLEDPRRMALLAQRDRCIERTVIESVLVVN